MFPLNQIKRRYAPPTCTLEIWATRSPLSKFQKRPIVKNLQFQLRFDDPRRMQDEQIILKGDRQQLDLLCDTVTTYIQNILLPAPVPAALRAAPSSPAPTPLNPSQLPFLRPQGLLQHELFLGTLLSPSTSVPLSTTQLFDLGTVLDQYQAEIDLLPRLSSSSSTIVPAWAKTAAFLIIASGVTMTLYLNQQAEQQRQTSISIPELQDLNRPPIGVETLPSLPDAPPAPTPSLPSDLAQRPRLAPPPPVNPGDIPINTPPTMPGRSPSAPQQTT
ncbi:DUF4335 domain-containing protein, partial [Spirulina subsalsa FACHB-351]